MKSIEAQYKSLLNSYLGNSTLVDNFWKNLKNNYSHKSRNYHNLTHIENMLMQLYEVVDFVNDVSTLKMTIFYHDVIYKATKSDNEYQSAKYMEKDLSKTSFSSIEKCFKQIEATKLHQLSKDNDTNILLDLDLAILGQDGSTYQKYTESIRKEYSIYPTFMYNKGRIKALEHLLGDGNIFKTPYFIEKYEHQAKKNIKEEIEKLRLSK